MTTMRKLDINLYDTNVGIWQDDANDPSFEREIFQGLLRLLRRLGWRVTADPDVLKRYRCISKWHRLAERGTLRAELHVSGRAIDIKFWSELAIQTNRYGRRHDFDKRERTPYLDRLRIDLETRRILDWLEMRATLSERVRRDRRCGPGFGELTVQAWLADNYARFWHTDPALGRPRYTNGDRDRTGKDGGLIDHGATVWFLGEKGRVLRGTAWYQLNNRWLVQVGPYGRYFLSAFEIFTQPPLVLRGKTNIRARRSRLEGELVRALRHDDYRRAELLKRILFGDAPIYRIWSRKNDSFYGTNSCGYTADAIGAGRYTREEAEREVRRVPHILSLVMPDGTHLTVDQLDPARAA